MASPAKVQRPENVAETVNEAVNDVDIQLKALCYDINAKNGRTAIAAVERIRRKLKALDGKCKALAKISNVGKSQLSTQNKNLTKENTELKERVKLLKKIE